MRNILTATTVSAHVLMTAACSTVQPPAPYGPVPRPEQVEWQKMETNMFVHFGPNTFTNSEWGNGKEDADVFAPTDLDCRQWARTAKAAGMKGIIITAKHHDGFCLWPNPASRHTVAQSSWRDGKGDILKDLSEACREYGLKFGVYISPWDRNDPTYGTDEYNEVFCRTLDSALGNYGEVFEQWFDGACGEGPGGKRQTYDWPLYHETVYRHQPDAVIFSDVGPGCRWIGNERGIAGETCRSTLDTAGFSPGKKGPSLDTLNCGNAHGKAWIPGEADVSIRPGWFYRESEDSKVKTLTELLEIYYGSVGRNSLLLLNVPPDKRGLICSIDSLRLMEFRAALDRIFATDMSDGASAEASSTRGGSGKYSPANMLDGNYDTYWCTDDNVTSGSVTFHLDGPKTFNRIMLQEYIPLGQRVAGFSVDIQDEAGNWSRTAEATTIGYKRILLTKTVTAKAVRINIEKAYACPVLNGFGLYMDDVTETADNTEDDTVHKVLKADEAYTLDLGKTETISGFFYEPGKFGKDGCIVCYNLETSTDGRHWTAILNNEMFNNIVNNPVRQEVEFASPAEARYLRITPTRTNLPDTWGLKSFGAL